MPREHPNTVLARRHFDRIAAEYDSVYVPNQGGYDAFQEVILASLLEADVPAIRVLELGSGTGNLAKKILELIPGSRVVGYDLSSQMILQAREKLAAHTDRVTLIEADISRAEFPGPFDAVVSTMAVHHVSPRSKPGLFRRLYDTLAPGGFVAIADCFRPASLRLGATYKRHAEMVKRRRRKGGGSNDRGATPPLPEKTYDDGGSSTQVLRYLRWIKQAGFRSVDCVVKTPKFGIVYGERPR